MTTQGDVKRRWLWLGAAAMATVLLGGWWFYRWSGEQEDRLAMTSRLRAARVVLGARGFARANLAVYLADETASPGAHAIEVSSTETLYLSTPPVLDSADLFSARVGHNAYGAPTLRLALDPEASSRFETFTREHMGRRLVFLAGEQLLMAPRIAGPATERFVEVESAMTLTDLQVLAARLSVR